MTDKTDEFEEMRLLGYVKLTEQGFALPAYSARPGANAWYVAIASVEGDHASTIARFELLEEEDVLPLPNPSITVSAGAPWQDVFLWAGRVFAGTPSQLLDAIAPFQDQVRELAPLSYLDLAVAAEAPVAAELAAGALAFLEGKLGATTGAASFMELVLRPGVLIELQRQYRKMGPNRLPGILHHFIMREHEPGTFEVKMARGTASAIGGDPAADELRASIARFGDLIGLSLFASGLEAREPAPALAETPPERPPPTPEYQTVERVSSVQPFPRILIIAADRRAAQIARFLEPPVEVAFGSGSVWGAERWRIDRLRGFSEISPGPHDAVIKVLETIDPDMPLDEFALVVWLAGNEALRDERAGAVLAAVRTLKADTPFLIAPAPPPDGPSDLLAERGNSERLLRQCHAVIDTTLARSPFWAGHPRRSVDRRMADIVAITSVVAALDSRLWEPLRNARGSKQPRVLSFVGGQSRFDVERATASELNAATLSSQPGDPIHTRVGFEMRERSSKRVQNAFLDLQPLRPAFEQFAEAAVVEAVDPGRPLHGPLSARVDVPASILRTMDHPDLAVVVDASGQFEQRIVITAEAPYLRTLREADHKGASAVRYTDVESLKALTKHHRFRPLPRDIRLPRLHRYPRNRGLVTRGVDIRDVFRLTEAQWADLNGRHSRSELVEQARQYMAAIDTRGANSEIVLPGPAVWNASSGGDALADEVVERLAGRKRDIPLSGKRTADLLAAWSRPANKVHRWVLEDGRLPVELTVLDPGSVPAQRLFFIDGDSAVPVFLLSRMFEVWARALLPSATSWAARFQVSTTFDAFPFPWSFEVYPPENGNPAHLRFSHRNETGGRLADLVGPDGNRLVGVTQEFRRDERSLRDHPLMREIDKLLLEDFHLSSEASDLDILEVLVERNQGHM